MLIVWFFVYKNLAQFAVRGALPPRRSESPGCAADNKPSCVLHLLGSFIGSRGFSSLEQRPEFWVLHSSEKKQANRCREIGDKLYSVTHFIGWFLFISIYFMCYIHGLALHSHVFQNHMEVHLFSSFHFP